MAAVCVLQLKCSDTASHPGGALQLQAAAQAGSPVAGPLWAHSPLREAHTTYHSVPHLLSASQPLLCCCTAGKREAHTNSASAALQGCHGEPQQRWREILQQFPLLPQLFFPPQLALLSATEDPALKGTGKGKMFLAR